MKNNIFKNKVILVTGGVGSIGSQIVKTLLKYNPKQIRIFDMRETELVNMQRELVKHDNLSFLLGNVRDKERLNFAMRKVNIVFHAAALKHVPACEYNPFEAVKTNVDGTQNVIEAAIKNDVERVVNISTDKVTNAINTMGATKLLAERLTIAAHHYKGDKKTIFSSVRFGNVLNSSGSIIGLFKNQIENKNPITITSPDMTRFIMSIPQAVKLVLETAKIAQGGEIFILKMPVFKLNDLTEVIIEEEASRLNMNPNAIKIKNIGLRAGEKMFEDLMTEEESKNTLETKSYFIIIPKLIMPNFTETKRKYADSKKTKSGSYSSNEINPLSKQELKKILYLTNCF
jgi:UDP-N-acetylglucosamine 4,6-dehydratase/5-epimerase